MVRLFSQGSIPLFSTVGRKEPLSRPSEPLNCSFGEHGLSLKIRCSERQRLESMINTTCGIKCCDKPSRLCNARFNSIARAEKVRRLGGWFENILWNLLPVGGHLAIFTVDPLAPKARDRSLGFHQGNSGT